MRFGFISLTNYIGIYQGLGLNYIEIDFTKCKYRTVIIKGDNGSGKTTLQKALDVFPDGNDSFIPGLPAKKEVVLIDNETLYKLVFIHGIKNNGERDTTKAYISKIINGYITELNPNGNVGSYKDILYTELTLDPNFTALSQLSLDDRGLADKKPAERKRFVNSIIESLEVYNNIYKTLSKKSGNYKNLISSISSKLGAIGDINILQDNLNSLENIINNKMNEKDEAAFNLASCNATISILDPDGKIRVHYKELQDQKNKTILRYEKLSELLNSKISCIYDISSFTDDNIDSIERRISKLEYIVDIRKQSKLNLMRQLQEESQYIISKSNRLNSITNSSNYDEMVYTYSNYIDQLQQLKDAISVTNINPESISKAEYIVALETLKDIKENIDHLRDSIDFDILEKVIFEYSSHLVDPSVGYLAMPQKFEIGDISKIDTEIALIQHSLEQAKKLENRPTNCKIDTCFFIKDAVDFMKTNPEKRLQELYEEKKSIEESIENRKKAEEIFKQKQEAIRYIYQIIKYIEKNGDILKKIGIFDTPDQLFDGILSGKSFDYMMTIYQHIELANLFDEYNHILKLSKSLKSEIDILDSKKEIIDELTIELQNLNIKVNRLQYDIKIIDREITISEQQLKEQKILLENFIECNRIMKEIEDCSTMISNYDRELNSLQEKASKTSSTFDQITELKNTITKLTNEIEPMMTQRDKLYHNIETAKEYVRELDELKNYYEVIEKIKYYTSPTTGIQLVFMELYMGKIIDLANELLSLLFGGVYKIQPFIINESEFRIPCLGEGYLNDDISSMSSAQISMISMILSFSLLHHSSTKYNIIKLDEIDGPLDEGNRIVFIDVLNRIMDIMGTEQCIMISHNSELQMNNCDIILLKSNNGIINYNNGNIIWKY